MQINGSELISRSTQTSARALVVISSALILVEYYSLQPIKWPLLDKDLPIKAYETAGIGIIFFSMVSLLVHWGGDYVSYTKWFKGNSIAKGSPQSDFSSKISNTPLEALEKRFSWLDDRILALEQAIESSKLELPTDARKLAELDASLQKMHRNITETSSQIVGIREILSTLDARFEAIVSWSKFTIFVWYLAMPVGLGAIALLLIWKSPSL